MAIQVLSELISRGEYLAAEGYWDEQSPERLALAKLGMVKERLRSTGNVGDERAKVLAMDLLFMAEHRHVLHPDPEVKDWWRDVANYVSNVFLAP